MFTDLYPEGKVEAGATQDGGRQGEECPDEPHTCQCGRHFKDSATKTITFYLTVVILFIAVRWKM